MDAGGERRQGQGVVEVDIRHQGYMDLADDLTERCRRLRVDHRAAGQVTPARLQTMNLGHRRGDIPRVGVGHRLHRNRSVAADADGADPNGT